jgi:L-ornithine N5-oxygenase
VPSAVSMISPHHKIIHSSIYSTSIHSILSSIASSRSATVELSHCPVKVAVIGGGQSAAEVVIDLRSRLQDVLPSLHNEDGNPVRHEIDLIIGGGSLKPSDDSPFSNETFDPTCACVDVQLPNFRLSLSPATDMFFNLRTKAARDMMLREFKLTNYGVVSPHTLDNVSRVIPLSLYSSHTLSQLYDLLYEQQMDDSIAKRANLDGDEEDICRQSVPPPRVTIRKYSSLVAVDPTQAPPGASANSGGNVFLLTFQSGLTKQLSQLKFDAVICATGYDRSSWFQLLRRSELGKHFIHGDPSSNGPVHVLPDHAQESDSENLLPSDFHVEAPGMTDGPTPTSSNENTPPTSPGSSSPILGGHSGYRDIGRDPPSKVYITRTYQLVPKNAGVEPLPRVYVQGCTESTHGLSETLLSVMSVRAGEIAGDLMGA